MKSINIAIDEDVHRQWRMQAAKYGMTLKDFVIMAAKREVKPDVIAAATSEKYADAAKKGGEKK